MAKTFDNKDVSYNKGKSYNLSRKQLKSAGAAKAANKRTVSISSTKRATTGAMKGKTLGPGGKPLTGSVKLPSGVTAVYKDGKRVTSRSTVPKVKNPTSGGSSSSSRGTTRRPSGTGTPAQKTKNPKGTTVTRGDGSKSKITTNRSWKGGGDMGAMAPRPGEYQAGRGQTARPKAAAPQAAKPKAAGKSKDSSGREGSSLYNSQVPRKNQTGAEAAYSAVSKAVSSYGKKATGPWISEADKAKERAKRKMNREAIERAIGRRK